MDKLIVTTIVNTLKTYTRPDGSSFLSSPSLREDQLNARDRQARELGGTIPIKKWEPLERMSAPATGYAARWTEEFGWVAVVRSGDKSSTLAHPLPDLPPSHDHPIFEPNVGGDDRNPIIRGGNRTGRGPLYLHPADLGIATGIFFHTKDLASFSDGGSWVVTDATLVWDNRRNKGHYSWSGDDVTRFPCQVIAAVFWEKESPDSRRVYLQQLELLVRRDGKWQRLLSTAMHGEMRAILCQLSDNVGAFSSNEESLIEWLDKVETSPQAEPPAEQPTGT